MSDELSGPPTRRDEFSVLHSKADGSTDIHSCCGPRIAVFPVECYGASTK